MTKPPQLVGRVVTTSDIADESEDDTEEIVLAINGHVHHLQALEEIEGRTSSPGSAEDPAERKLLKRLAQEGIHTLPAEVRSRSPCAVEAGEG